MEKGSFWLNMGDTYSGSGKGHGWIDPKYKNQYSARNELSSSQ
ncbi:unnamed protein product [marine sediment metagenome]|uniref:Uncharacterized protein n=1 Tax=marine sediment metagenome TaxID=412755 RepID=X1EKH2_9ZZZZ